MNIQEQLREAGLELLDGHRRVQAALCMGTPVIATDGLVAFRITEDGGRIVVEPITVSDSASPTITVRKIANFVTVATDSLVPNPANTLAGQIYSLRAECESDAKRFLDEVETDGLLLSNAVHPDQDGFPDVEIELVSNATLEQLRSVIRRMPDGHVMLQTLRQVPLAGNSLERDESFN